MIKLTPELKKEIKESGIPIIEITLQDLLKAEKTDQQPNKK